MAIGDFGSGLKVSLQNITKELSSSFQKLSSGKRINKASDDAAGLAIVAQLESSVKTSLQGARNAVDGISIADIADSALSNISDITSRQSELAAQAANGTLSDEQRTSLNNEFQALEQEKNRIIETTEFNGVNVFNGGGTTLQVGTTGGAESQIQIPSGSTASLTSGGDISSQASAQLAIDSLRTTSANVTQLQGQIGAVVNRVQVASENAKTGAAEFEAAASRIRDADIADEAAKNVSARIRQQATTALSAQANNINAQSVLKLLS